MAWLGSAWKKRKSVLIAGTVDGVQTNYQMKLTVYRSAGADAPGVVHLGAGGCLSNYNDIRFTTSNGTTPLDYWIESSDAASATIWIEFDSIPAAASSGTFYIYYGNPSAVAVSNGPATFVIFNSGASIDGWTDVTASGGTGCDFTIVGGKIRATGVGATPGAFLYCNTQTGLTQYKIEAKIQHGADNDSCSGIRFDTTQSNAFRGFFRWSGLANIWQLQTATLYNNSGVDAGFNPTTETRYKLIRDGNTFTGHINDVLKCTQAEAFNAQYIGLYVTFPAAGNTCDFSDIRVSKHTTNEPTWSTWGTEEGYGVRTRSMTGVGC